MSDEIFFDGVRYVSANEAGSSADLTRDYVARLCRDGKVRGRRIGKNWYVDHKSFQSFLVSQEYSKSRRGEELVRERVREYHGIEAPLTQVKVSALQQKHERIESKILHDVQAVSSTLVNRADEIKNKMAAAVAAQAGGAIGHARVAVNAPGGFAHAAFSATHVPVYVLSPVMEFFHKVTALVLALMLTFGTYAVVDPKYARFAADTMQEEIHSALASYRSFTGGGINAFADRAQVQVAAAAENPAATFAALQNVVVNDIPDAAAHLARTFNKSVNDFVYSIAFPLNLMRANGIADSDAGSVTLEIVSYSNTGGTKDGATFAAASSQPVSQVSINNPVIERIFETQRIVTLGGITEEILNKKIEELNSKLSAQMLTLSSANSTQTTNVYQTVADTNRIEHLKDLDLLTPAITGGSITGTSISASSLAVTGTATSTFVSGLDISDGCFAVDGVCINGSGTGQSWELVGGYLAPTTSVPILVNNATSTITNLVMVNSTSTNATTTNLTVFTALVAPSFTATSTTASILPYASTTALTASGMSYLTGGFLSLASSTIGGGTQATGLTISGGATTTGNAYFAGNIGVGNTSPAFKLDVSGAAETTFQYNPALMTLKTTDSVAANMGGGITFGGVYTGSTQTTWASIGGVKENGTAGDYGGKLVFGTRTNGQNGTYDMTRMVIDSTGNVGIGTTTPWGKLVVALKSGETYGGNNAFVISSSTASATTTLFSVSNTGAVSAAGGNITFSTAGRITAATDLIAGAAGTIGFLGRAGFTSPADSVLNLIDSAGTGFTRLNLGPNTSSFPALKRNGAAIDLRLADDSAYANLTLASLFSSNASSSNLSVFSTAYFGGTSTTTIDSTGAITVTSTSANTFPYASTTALTAANLFSTIASSSLFLASDGSATAPTFSFGSATDLGIYKSAANTIGFSSVGTLRFTLAGGTFAGNTSAGPALINVGASSISPNIVPNKADTSTGFNSGTVGHINVITGGIERARWTNTGFGIGTTSPYALLAVTATSTSGLGAPRILFDISSTTQGTATTTLFSISNTGLGYFSGGFLALASSTIGDGTQTGGLTVSGGATTTAGLYVSTAASSYDGLLAWRGGDSKKWVWGADANGTYLRNSSDSTFTLAVLNAGAIGSGDTSPDFKFETVGSSGSGYFGITNATDGDIFTVNSSGNVGIGTTTPWAKFSIANSTNDTAAQYLFAISSSTASATTTLFSVNNTGDITITGSNGASSGGLRASISSTDFIVNSNGLSISRTGTTNAAQASIGGSSVSSAPSGSGGSGGLLVTTANAQTGTANFSSIFANPSSITTTSSGYSNFFTAYLSNATANRGIYFGTNYLNGFGTSTPFAKLAIHANDGETNTTLFAIGSSTASATTTLFSVPNTTAGTSTFATGLQATYLNLTGAVATSTASNGFNLIGGCFSINGACIGGGGGSSNWTDGGAYLSPLAAGDGVLINSASSTITNLDIVNSTSTNATSSRLYTGGQTILAATGGSVGVGTTTPRALFAVHGNGLFSGNLTLAGLYATSTIDTNGTTGGYKINGNLILQASSTKSSVAVGQSALNAFYTGTLNTAVGFSALTANTSGSYNSAFGFNALISNTSGQENVAVGQALYFNQGGSNNVGVGDGALNLNVSGSGNIGLGLGAGYSGTGSNNISIGTNADVPSAAGNQQLNIGNVIFGTGMYNGASVSSAPVSDGKIGIGTTTPFGKLALAAIGGETFTNNILFSIGSSTAAFATTTLFSIDNTGLASLINLLVLGSTTLQNFTALNATTSNATSTTLFATVASSTSLYSQTASLGTVTIGSLSLNSALAVTQGGTGAALFTQGWIYSNGGTGALAASTSPTINYVVATSTTVASQFWGGLLSLASSTIGNGTQTGGLTISGGATTTGTTTLATLGGSVGVGTVTPWGRLSISSANLPQTWALVAASTSVTNADSPTLATLSSNRVAFIDSTNDELRTYEFNGATWTQVGGSLVLSDGTTPRISALSPNRIAFYDSNIDALKAYEFNGTTWVQVGNSFSISATEVAALAALSPNRVAFIDGSNDSLQTYEFNGIVWMQVGTPLSISSANNPALTTLSPNRVAFIDSAIDLLQVYEFTGTTWVAVGTGLSISIAGGNNSALAALSPNRVAFIDGNNDSLRVYEFNGTIWVQIGTSLSITTTGSPALAALSPNRVAFIDGTNERLSTYQFSSPTFFVGNGSDYPFLSVSDAGYTTAEGLAVRTSLTVGQSATSTWGTSTPALIVNGPAVFSGLVGLGTTTPWAQLTILSNQTATSSLLFAIASTSHVNFATTTHSLFTVDSRGNVGIGTTTPFGKFALHALGTDTFTNNTLFSIASSTSAFATTTLFSLLNTGDAYFAGSVGIATTTPGAKLAIYGGFNGAPASSGVTDSNVAFRIRSSTNVLLDFGSSMSPVMNWVQSRDATNFVANYALALNPNGGNVGIGTTTPFRKFSVTDTVSTAQAVVAYDTTRYAELRVDSSGDLNLGASGNDIFLNNDNLWVCTGGNFETNGCPSGAPSGQGNLIVETKVGIATTTPNWPLQLAGTRPSFAISDSNATTDRKHWLFSSMNGFLYMGTSTDAYATSTTAAITINPNGFVGVGTSSPSRQLSTGGLLYVGANSLTAAALGTATSTFNGDVRIGGKLDVSTIDPVYTIDGTKYATYGHSTVGIKEETLQTIELTEKDASGKYAYTISFDELEKGSDLWLFWQITDFGTDWKQLVVSLTPSFDGSVFYKKDSATNTLVIYSDAPGEVSMRLAGNRFDFSKWGNLRPDQDDDFTHFELQSKPALIQVAEELPSSVK